MHKLNHFIFLFSLIVVFIPQTTAAEFTFYVNSTYQGWFSNGKIATPFKNFESAISKACDLAASDPSITTNLIFDVSAPFELSNQISRSNCGKIIFTASTTNSTASAVLNFGNTLQLNSTEITFSSFTFKISNTAKISSGFFQAYNSKITLFESILNSSTILKLTSQAFFVLNASFLTIDSSKILADNTTIGSRLNDTNITVSNTTIYLRNEPKEPIFWATSHLKKTPLELIISNGKLLLNSSPSIPFFYTFLFFITNMNVTVDGLEIEPEMQGPNDGTSNNLIKGVIGINHTELFSNLSISRLKVRSTNLYTPIVLYMATGNLTSVSVKEVEINDCNKLKGLRFDYFDNAIMGFKMDGYHNKFEAENVKLTEITERIRYEDLSYQEYYISVSMSKEYNKVLFTNFMVVSCSFTRRVFEITGVYAELDISIIAVRDTIFQRPFIFFNGEIENTFDDEENQNHRIGFWKMRNFLAENVTVKSQLIILKEHKIIPEEFDNYLPIKYFNFENFTMSNVKVLAQRSGNPLDVRVYLEQSFAVISLEGIGVKLNNSAFANITLKHANFILMMRKMVPLHLENSEFADFRGITSQTRFFCKLNSILVPFKDEVVDLTSLMIYPNLASVAIINNKFSGTWRFPESQEIITLNVVNLFILNNTFENIVASAQGAFFWASYFIEPNPHNQLDNLEPNKIKEFIIDPQFLTLYEKYWAAEPSRSLSARHIYDSNTFLNLTLNQINLIEFGGSERLLHKLVFLSNTFKFLTTIRTDIDEEVLEPKMIMALREVTNITVKGNSLTQVDAFIRFLDSINLGHIDTNVSVASNFFVNNSEVAFCQIIGKQFSALKIMNNMILSSDLSFGNMMSLSHLGGGLNRTIDFVGNAIFNVTVKLHDFTTAGILNFQVSSRQHHVLMLFENNTITECRFKHIWSDPIKGMRNFLFYLSNPNGSIIISDSWISDNLGPETTALMAVIALNTAFRDFTLRRNPPIDADSVWESTISVYTYNIEIKSSSMEFNRALEGGAFKIDIMPGNKKPIITVQVQNSTFLANSAVRQGGAIYFCDKIAKRMAIQITNCTFVNNLARKGGGAVFLAMQELLYSTINDTYFEYSLAEGGRGDLLYLENLYFDTTEVNRKSMVLENIHITVSTTEKATKPSQLIYLFAFVNTVRNLQYSIENLTLKYKAKNGSQIPAAKTLLYLDNVLLTIVRLNISDYVTSSSFIEVSDLAKLTIIDSIFHRNKFVSNTASYEQSSACAIAMRVGNTIDELALGYLVVSGTVLSENSILSTNLKNGLLCIQSIWFNVTIDQKSKIVMNNCANKRSLISNEPADDLVLKRDRKEKKRLFRLSEAEFADNSCDAQMGAVVKIEAANVSIENCTFSRNQDAFGGGALGLVSLINLQILNSVFSSNSVNIGLKNDTLWGVDCLGGGAICILPQKKSQHVVFLSIPIIRNCTFYNNSAFGGQGGAIFYAQIPPENLSPILREKTPLRLTKLWQGTISRVLLQM